MPRRIYPLVTTQEVVGHERRHTVMVGDREVEIDGRDMDELPELEDDAREQVHAGQRRRARVTPARRAFAEARSAINETSAIDDDD